MKLALRIAGRPLRTNKLTFTKPRIVPTNFYQPLSVTHAAAPSHNRTHFLSFFGFAAAAAATATATATTVSTEASKGPVDIVLYQYAICPFCNKVKAVMDYLKIPYKTIEVDPVSKAQLKKLGTDYKKVPVAMIDGEQINDSKLILKSVLETALKNNLVTTEQLRHLHEGTKGAESVDKWLEWSDEGLGVLIFPNITATLSESLEAFSYIKHVSEWSAFQRAYLSFFGGVAMKLANGKIKKKYNIDDHRQALYDAVALWLKEIDAGGYHGGSSPDLADLAVYGVVRSVHHTTTHAEMMQNTPIAEWYGKMATTLGPGGPYPPK